MLVCLMVLLFLMVKDVTRELILISNHNICGVRMDCGSEVSQEYGLKYDRAFNGWNLLEIDII
jgi:hypothetical protein